MRPVVTLSMALLVFAACAGGPIASASAPPPADQRAGAPPATPQPPPGQRGRGGRGAVQIMTLTTPAWPDGGTIPVKHAQAGEDVSPPLAWSNVPENIGSFVLVVHDLDAATSGGRDDTLHWLVWNIPGTATGLPDAVPHGPTRPDGSRQISVSGPYYRGPAAPATGPAHHYVFELYALDAMIEVPPVGASPAETRASVMAAMAGHVRGKAVMVGLYRRR